MGANFTARATDGRSSLALSRSTLTDLKSKLSTSNAFSIRTVVWSTRFLGTGSDGTNLTYPEVTTLALDTLSGQAALRVRDLTAPLNITLPYTALADASSATFTCPAGDPRTLTLSCGHSTSHSAGTTVKVLCNGTASVVPYSTVCPLRVTCKYWNSTLASWSNHGCTMLSAHGGLVTCRCTHLSDFTAWVEEPMGSVVHSGGALAPHSDPPSSDIILVLAFIYLAFVVAVVLIHLQPPPDHTAFLSRVRLSSFYLDIMRHLDKRLTLHGTDPSTIEDESPRADGTSKPTRKLRITIHDPRKIMQDLYGVPSVSASRIVRDVIYDRQRRIDSLVDLESTVWWKRKVRVMDELWSLTAQLVSLSMTQLSVMFLARGLTLLFLSTYLTEANTDNVVPTVSKDSSSKVFDCFVPFGWIGG